MLRTIAENFGLSTPTRRTGYLLVFGLILLYGLFALQGPFGVRALLEKHREIRQLEEQNALMSQENQRRRERIERLRSSPDEQRLEIEKKLKLQRPGETIFVLPTPKTQPAEAAPADR